MRTRTRKVGSAASSQRAKRRPAVNGGREASQARRCPAPPPPAVRMLLASCRGQSPSALGVRDSSRWSVCPTCVQHEIVSLGYRRKWRPTPRRTIAVASRGVHGLRRAVVSENWWVQTHLGCTHDACAGHLLTTAWKMRSWIRGVDSLRLYSSQ